MLDSFRSRVTHLQRVAARRGAKLLHRAHNGADLAYFAVVFIEAHGAYGKIAGVLFCIGVARVFLKEEV